VRCRPVARGLLEALNSVSPVPSFRLKKLTATVGLPV
jgi:hypothetical protein